MSYIMKLEQPFEQESELLSLFQIIEQQRPAAMVKLYDCQKASKCSCGSPQTNQKVQSYWEYYNFYLSDLIARRQAKNVFFSE
jgi:hypothetical protein